MATTFVGIELGGDRVRPRHSAVVLWRRRHVVELRHWSCLIRSGEDLLDYLVSVAGQSGVIAVHGADPDLTADMLKRIWRVLDYRLLFALAPRHRTRALVRVEPAEVNRAFAANSELQPRSVLEGLRGLAPAVDYHPLAQCLDRLPGARKTLINSTFRAGLNSYAALWCWWHGPAGYDVLGADTDSYRLAPRMMDFEPDTDSRKY